MNTKNRFDTHRLWRWAVLALAVLAASPCWAAVGLQLDRDRVMVGETVTLTFVTDNSRQSLDADFSVLESDFEILDRRTESQISIVNGRQTAVVRLLLTVEPKHDGDIQIPSFRFDNEETKPVMLRVDPAPELAPGELPPVFIEVELTPDEGPFYVHAQFGLVVRVFYQQNLTEAAISQPEPSPASVRLLQETPYQAERGGERYRVLERHYAIFPERSGELIIPAMELSGRLVERRSSGIWQPTVRGRRVRASSEEVRLQVEPRPAAFSGTDWQPARDLKVSQQISSGEALRVGEPVTRTVMVDATGLEENMIAEPRWPVVENARIYPDQPQGITRDDGRWVLGHKEFRYAVVPEKEGELVLPELRIDWWDTRNNEQKTAVLPPHTLYVKPSALVPLPSQPAAAMPEPGTPVPAEPFAAPGGGAWKWAALLFGVLWLLTLAALLTLARRNGNGADAGRARPADERETAVLHALRKACNKGDRVAARRGLQRWLGRYGPTGNTSLLEFSEHCGEPDLRHGLRALDAEGFRPGTDEAWDGRAFWRQLDAWRKRLAQQANGGGAPVTDLYAKENRTRQT